MTIMLHLHSKAIECQKFSVFQLDHPNRPVLTTPLMMTPEQPMNLSNISVSARIWAGFIIVQAMLVLVSVSAHLGSDRVENNVENFARVSGNSTHVLMVDRNFAHMRRSVVSYVNTGEEAHIEPVKEMTARLRQDIAAATDAVADPERKAGLKTMTGLLEAYAGDFDKAVILRKKSDDLVDRTLNPQGMQARRQVSEAIDAATARQEYQLAATLGKLQETLMLMQLNANKYLSHPEDALIADVKKDAALVTEQTKAATALIQEPAIRQAVQTAAASIATYEKTFADVSRTIRERNDLVNLVMVKEAAEFGDMAAKTLAAQTAYLQHIHDETDHDIEAQNNFGLITSIIALLIGQIAAYVIARSVIRPVNAITGVMSELANDNLSVEVPYVQQRDEMGKMAVSVNHFKMQLMRVRQLEAEQAEQKRRAELDRQAAMSEMADAFEGSVGQVVQTVTSAVTELQASAEQMAATAAETSAQASTVAAASQEASANVQTVAAASEELTASINEIAQQVERSLAVAAQAESEAQQTSQMIEALSDAVGRIDDIVNLINSIAGQTNLLALNATIEAARAGEAGKGFAVVANEVKGLAGQTAKATGEIASHIQAVQQGTANAVNGIRSIATVIADMNRISAAVAAAVQEQSSATGEISRNVDQAAAGTQEVSNSITVVEQAAGDTGAAAAQIRSSALDLSKQAEYLGGEVGRFLAQVRSGRDDMQLIVWDSAFVTGLAELDKHHKDYIDTINRYYGMMMTGDGGAGTLKLLAFIEREMPAHFAAEEQEMRTRNYTETAQHLEGHRIFLDRLKTARAALERNDPAAAAEMFKFLAKWTREHFSNYDRKLAQFLAAA
jgi:methyl-accepting chemotaxis protein